MRGASESGFVDVVVVSVVRVGLCGECVLESRVRVLVEESPMASPMYHVRVVGRGVLYAAPARPSRRRIRIDYNKESIIKRATVSTRHQAP